MKRRIEEMAKVWAKQASQQGGTAEDWQAVLFRPALGGGSSWGYRDIKAFVAGYRAAAEELRSDEAVKMDVNNRPLGLAPHDWADWLEREE